MRELKPVPLTPQAFAPFGEVIELAQAQQISINQGLTTRFHDLLTIDADDQGGHPIVNVFRTNPISLPHMVSIMERHPLGSQAFLPMDNDPFLVLVAEAGDAVTAETLKLFITDGNQGINLFKNTWHHFQLVLNRQRDFLVVDRGGPGNNLEEVQLQNQALIPEIHIKG